MNNNEFSHNNGNVQMCIIKHNILNCTYGSVHGY